MRDHLGGTQAGTIGHAQRRLFFSLGAASISRATSPTLSYE